jgi:DNA-binding FadR family transcriptional regulator
MEHDVTQMANPLPSTDMTGESQHRLYREVARQLTARIVDGTYAVGGRLPAEREIAADYNVSRPTVREAIIAMEVQGLVEVRIGSGAYVRRQPEARDRPDFGISAFELTEARLLFEGEAAALAATHITDEELAELSQLVDQIRREQANPASAEEADREFHLVIARATRNAAVVGTIETLWEMRRNSPESALLHEKARAAKVKPAVDEHQAIVESLRSRDPAAARNAMRDHLGAVIEHLLFATEEEAIQRARENAQNTRARFARLVGS